MEQVPPFYFSSFIKESLSRVIAINHYADSILTLSLLKPELQKHYLSSKISCVSSLYNVAAELTIPYNYNLIVLPFVVINHSQIEDLLLRLRFSLKQNGLVLLTLINDVKGLAGLCSEYQISPMIVADLLTKCSFENVVLDTINYEVSYKKNFEKLTSDLQESGLSQVCTLTTAPQDCNFIEINAVNIIGYINNCSSKTTQVYEIADDIPFL